ncbi:MAG: hypothetical protein AAF355_09230 [Myxococcota bacterium]
MEFNSVSETSERLEPRAVRILARSVYRELKAAGCERADIVRFTNELLAQLTRGNLSQDRAADLDSRSAV